MMNEVTVSNKSQKPHLNIIKDITFHFCLIYDWYIRYDDILFKFK